MVSERVAGKTVWFPCYHSHIWALWQWVHLITGRYTSVRLLLPTTTEELLPLLHQHYCFVGRDHSALWLCWWCALKLLVLRKKQFVNSIVLCLQLRICILRCVFPQWQRSGENTQPDWRCCRPGRWSRRKIFTGAVCLSVIDIVSLNEVLVSVDVLQLSWQEFVCTFSQGSYRSGKVMEFKPHWGS